MAKPELLASYWNSGIEEDIEKCTAEELSNYRYLKFCLCHFGGSSEWIKYLKDPWLPSAKKPIDSIFEDWNHHVYENAPEGEQEYSWHTLIYEMLTTFTENSSDQLLFPNLYADISYNLSNEQMLPLLKIRLDSSRSFSEKVLFGTDFYMVSTEGSEREISMKLRSFIGEENFKQIAKLNPLDFLFTNLTKTGDLLG
jgi:hypothetical protein